MCVVPSVALNVEDLIESNLLMSYRRLKIDSIVLSSILVLPYVELRFHGVLPEGVVIFIV